MTAPRARTEAVRSEWLSHTVRECQLLVNLALHTTPTRLQSTARAFLDRLEPPATPLERLVERGLLLEIAVQFGHAAHVAFHRQYPEERTTAAPCAFEPSFAVGGWPRDLALSPAEAFRRWAARYAAGFRAAHPLACAREAEEYVRERFRTSIAARDLARDLECPVAFLRRTFQQLTGRTLLQYQSALRLQHALHLLTHTDLKMEAVATDVGYRSKKDLYRVIQANRACTPLEYRMRSRAGRETWKSGRSRKAAT